MKIKDNLTVRKIADEYMMVTASGSGLDYTRVIRINNTAAYLVQEVRKKEGRKKEGGEGRREKEEGEREREKGEGKKLIEKLAKEGLFVEE